MEWLKGDKLESKIGTTVELNDTKNHGSSIFSKFTNQWKSLMDDNVGEWTILEYDDTDIALATNRFTSRATRLNGYEYANGYQFRCIRRTPYSYFLGRKEV